MTDQELDRKLHAMDAIAFAIMALIFSTLSITFLEVSYKGAAALCGAFALVSVITSAMNAWRALKL